MYYKYIHKIVFKNISTFFGRSYIIIKGQIFMEKIRSDQCLHLHYYSVIKKNRSKFGLLCLCWFFFAVKRIITTGLNFYYMVNAYLLITTRKKFLCTKQKKTTRKKILKFSKEKLQSNKQHSVYKMNVLTALLQNNLKFRMINCFILFAGLHKKKYII